MSDPAHLTRPLPADTVLHVCLICGAVVAEKGVQFHDQWHHETAQAVIRSERRIDQMEAGNAA